MDVHMYELHRKGLENCISNCLQDIPLGSRGKIGSGAWMGTLNWRKIIYLCIVECLKRIFKENSERSSTLALATWDYGVPETWLVWLKKWILNFT